MFALKVILEVLAVLLIAYMIWHEEELIEIEEIIKKEIKRKVGKK